MLMILGVLVVTSKYTLASRKMLFPAVVLLIILTMEFAYSSKESTKMWNCSRTWPQLELFLPVAFVGGSRQHEYQEYFLRSILMFWPFDVSNTSLLFIADEEKITSSNHSHHIARLKEVIASTEGFIPGGISMKGAPPSPYYHNRGHDRQQLVMFWADNFTSSEFVGFCDSDTIFIQFVDREDIFIDGKPLVHGMIGVTEPMIRGPYFRQAFISAAESLGGLKIPMRCMNYFPIVIKTAHLKEMREYITRALNQSTFDEAFSHFTRRGGMFEQFTIMCAYLWYFKNSEYSWSIREASANWDGIHPRPLDGQSGNVSMFPKRFFSTPPRVAMHGRYRSMKFYSNVPQMRTVMGDTDELDSLFCRGLCYSPPFPKADDIREKFCGLLNNSGGSYFNEAHQFEFVIDRLVVSQASLAAVDRSRRYRLSSCAGVKSNEADRLFAKFLERHR